MSSVVKGNEAKNIVNRMENILERFDKNPNIYEISGIPIYIYLDSLSTRIDNIILYQDDVYDGEDGRWYKEFKEIMKDPTGLLKRMVKFECSLFNPLQKMEDEVIKITFDIIQNKEINKDRILQMLDFINEIEIDMEEFDISSCQISTSNSMDVLD